MSKFLTVVVAVLLSSTLFAAEWTDEQTGYTWSYSVVNGGIEVQGVSPKEGGDLFIPNEIEGKMVTSIRYSAFKGCSGFTGSLTIPDSVISIGESAFEGCSGFTGSLTIPDAVTSIGRYAFKYCSGFTGSLTISDSVTSIGLSAFYGCSGFTGSLTIPDSVTSIGDYAFEYCSGFTGSLTISDSVTYLGDFMFHGCSGFTGSLTIPDSVTKIGSRVFEGCSGFTGSLTMPDSVTYIGPSVIGGCSGITEIIFPVGLCPAWRSTPYTLGVYISHRYASTVQQLGFPIEYVRGYLEDEKPMVEIISSKIRESDPTIMDVTYRVASEKPTVKVRVLAFEDGERSFTKVVRPTTFIDGTEANVGDAVTANEEHTISWKVSADWQERLAKFKMDVFAMEEGDGLLPLELTTIPGTTSHPQTVQFSWNYIGNDVTLEALYWLYADNDLGLTLQNGQLKHGSQTLANGASVNGTGYDALVYVYDKMGYQLLEGDEYEYVKKASRLNLPGKSTRQYAYKIIER